MNSYITCKMIFEDRELELDGDESVGCLITRFMNRGPVKVTSDGEFLTMSAGEYKIITDENGSTALQVDLSQLAKEKMFICAQDLIFHREICENELFETEDYIEIHDFAEVVRAQGQEEYRFLHKPENVINNFETTITLKDNILTILTIDLEEKNKEHKYKSRYPHHLKEIYIEGMLDVDVTKDKLKKVFYCLEKAGIEYDLALNEEYIQGHSIGIDVLHILTDYFTYVADYGDFHRLEVTHKVVDKCYITNEEGVKVYLPDVIAQHEKEEQKVYLDLDEIPNVWHCVCPKTNRIAYAFGHCL